jgi:hypothetical protein
MCVKKLLIATAWASITWASMVLSNDTPPELPFEALDGTSLAPLPGEVPKDSWVRGGNNQAATPQADEMNGQVVNGNAQEPDHNQQVEPIEHNELPEPIPVQKPKPKPRKRPKVLDKAAGAQKIPAQVQ